METKLKIIPSKKAGQKPPTSNPGTSQLASIIIKALITKVNKPRVKILIGKVIKISNGFITIFMMPKTTATIKAVQNESTVTHGRT